MGALQGRCAVTERTPRRVTPTGRLILPADADRPAWLERRRAGLGSSDIPAVMGVVEQRTALHVYYSKTGGLPDDDAGEAALWGTLHEETVAREWYRRNRSVGRRVGLVAHVDAPWMMCTLDRRITECPLARDRREACALEVKTRSAWLSAHWRRDVPDDVLAQTLWQIAVTGYDHIHVAVLIGGNDYRQKVVRRDGNQDLIADITAVAAEFWHGHVRAGRPPDVEPSAAVAELYEQLYPERGGLVAPDPDDTLGALREYEIGRLRESAGKRQKAAGKAEMIRLLGEHQAALLDGHPAYSLEPTERRTCDLDRLAERWPDAYADCVDDKPGRRIAISKDYRMRPDQLENVT